LALVALVLTLALLCIPTSFSPSARLPLRRVADVRLPGSPSRFDYQAVDPTRRRIYVAHLGANQLDVVDLDHLTAVGAVDHVANVHGVQAAPDLDLVYASATGADEVIAIDATTLEVRFRVPPRQTNSYVSTLRTEPSLPEPDSVVATERTVSPSKHAYTSRSSPANATPASPSSTSRQCVKARSPESATTPTYSPTTTNYGASMSHLRAALSPSSSFAPRPSPNSVEQDSPPTPTPSQSIKPHTTFSSRSKTSTGIPSSG